MKRLTICILLCLLIFGDLAQAQDNDIKESGKDYKNHIGLAAGFTTGLGFAYRFMDKGWGFQVVAGPYVADHGDRVLASLGLTLLKGIAESRTMSFYGYLANSYNIDKHDEDYGNVYKEDSWNTGIGVGFEVDTRKRVVLDVMVGYAQYNTFETLFFTAELGLFYRF